MIPDDYTHHRDVIKAWIEGKYKEEATDPNPRDYYHWEGEPAIQEGFVIHQGPFVMVPFTIEFEAGLREMDSVVGTAFYEPHDGNLTVAINHMDYLTVIDNAAEMFTDEPVRTYNKGKE